MKPIFHSKINASEISRNFETYKNKLHNIYVRIPLKVLKEKPEIEKLVFPDPLIVYEGISKIKKPEKIKIPKDLDESKLKKLNSLNDFKEELYEFSKQKNEKEIEIVKIENKQFKNNFDKMQKNKNKYKTGTYLDHDYLISIANKYAFRRMKIPKISNDKNIFKGNPLILEGSELVNYFLYNFGNKYKSSIYLNKIDEIVVRKLTGNATLSDKEERRLEFLKKTEKPKGYIPPRQLISQLKKDIIDTQNAIKNINNLNAFLKEEKEVSNYEPKNYESKNTDNKSRNYSSLRNIYDYSTNLTNSSNNKIKIKKNFSLINYNKFPIRLNSSSSTKNYQTKRFSSLNSNRVFPYLERNNNSISNITSAISRDKSRLVSPSSFLIKKKNILDHLKQKMDFNKMSNKIKLKPFKYPDKIKGKALSSYNRIKNTIDSGIKKKDLDNNNNINHIAKKRLIKNSLKILKPLKIMRKFSIMSANSKESNANTYNEQINSRFESEEDEYEKNIKESNNKLNQDFSNNNNGINGNNNNNSDNNDNNKKYNKNNENDLIIYKNISKLNKDRYKNCETIFNSLVEGKFNINRSKSVLNDFLKERGYKNVNTLTSKDNLVNLNKIKNISERDYILEEYKLRSNDNGKSPLTEEQQIIIHKNNQCSRNIEQNEKQLIKLIYEKEINKETFDL